MCSSNLFGNSPPLIMIMQNTVGVFRSELRFSDRAAKFFSSVRGISNIPISPIAKDDDKCCSRMSLVPK